MLTLATALTFVSVPGLGGAHAAYGGGVPPSHLALSAVVGADQLEDVTWWLEEVNGYAARGGLGDGPYIRLNSADGVVTGYTGVNQFSARYRRRGDSLWFARITLTRRAGPPDLMGQEWAMRGMLDETTSWRAVGPDRIELRNGHGQLLARFVRDEME